MSAPSGGEGALPLQPQPQPQPQPQQHQSRRRRSSSPPSREDEGPASRSFLRDSAWKSGGYSATPACALDVPLIGRRAVCAVVTAYAPLRRRGGGGSFVLTDAAAALIYGAVERRLVQVLTLAIRLSKRSLRVGCKGRLTVADVKEATKALNLKPVLGYEGLSCSRFVPLPVEFEAYRALRRESVVSPEPLAPFVEASLHAARERRPQGAPGSSSESCSAVGDSSKAPFSDTACDAFVSFVGPSLASPDGALPSLQCLVSEKPLLKPPPPPVLAIHWTAVEGCAPWLPQNAVPLDAAAFESENLAATTEADSPEEGDDGGGSAAGGRREGRRRGIPGETSSETQLAQTEGGASREAASGAALVEGPSGGVVGETEGNASFRRTLKRRAAGEPPSSKEVLILCSEALSKGGQDRAAKAFGGSGSREGQTPSGADSSSLGLEVEEVLVAPKINHILGREQQLFLSSVEECLEAAGNEKYPGDCWRLFLKTLRVVASTCVVEALAAPLCRLFSLKVHQLLMPLMECLLQPLPLSSSREALGKESLSDGVDAEALAALLPLSPQAQELRRAAARVLGLLCKRCFRERNGLQSVASAAALQLQRHLLHPLSCLDTAAGAALGLVEIGSEAVRELLLPHARLLLHALERSQQLNEVELLAVFSARQQKPSARDASRLLSKQHALYLRAALAEELQRIILSSVLNELSRQITEERSLFGCAAPDAAALELTVGVLSDGEEGMRDSFVPLVAAAFHRVRKATAAAAAFSSAQIKAHQQPQFSAEAGASDAASIRPKLAAQRSRRALASERMSNVLALLSLMEKTVEAETLRATGVVLDERFKQNKLLPLFVVKDPQTPPPAVERGGDLPFSTPDLLALSL